VGATAAAECACFPLDQTVLKIFERWVAKLNFRQDYPGKVLLALLRHEEDVLSLRAEELEELWEAAGVVRDAVDRVLRPDWWNYMFAGNVVPHVHLHMIPRYATPRNVAGWQFRDGHWGRMHARQEEPPTSAFSWILESVKGALG